MGPLSYSERTWVIQQYLNGTLPDDLHKQVEERRLSDPGFDRQVLAQGLLAMYAESERNTLEFYAQTEPLAIELGKTRASYNTSKVIHTLPELIKLHPLLWASAAVIALIFTWAGLALSSSPVGKANVMAVQSDESNPYGGFGGKKERIIVVRYTRLPGWRGLLQNDSLYRWPGDTLFLYGKQLPELALDSLQIRATSYKGQYRLQMGNKRFRIQKSQPQTIPLQLDETP